MITRPPTDGVGTLAAVASGPPVPWIVTYTGDRPVPGDVMAHEGGLAYADEVLADRGPHGELLLRGTTPAPDGRRGQPQYAVIDYRRQRRAMRDLLCQVCGQAADRTDAGTLWVIDTPAYTVACARGLESGVLEPPVCLPCARIAVVACRELRKEGYVALRVPEIRLVGVTGALCAAEPHPRRPFELHVVDWEATMPFEDPRLPWMLVTEYRAALLGATRIDLSAERSTGA